MRPSRRPYVVTGVVFWVLPVVGFTLAHLLLPDTNADGQCTGLGWGCTLPPSDLALFLGILAVPTLFVVGALVMLGIALWRSRQRRRAAQGD